MRTLLILVVLAGLSLQSCEPEQNAVYIPDETCVDGIRNQDEIEVDCGGPCKACPSRLSATVDGVAWQAQGNVTSSTNNGAIIILSGNGNSNISIIYSGPFTTGSHNLSSALYQEAGGQSTYVANGGNITFTEWDTFHDVVSGTFSFTATETSSQTEEVEVTNGVFKYVPYTE